MDDAVLRAAGSGLPALRKISLDGCIRLTDDGIASLVGGGNRRKSKLEEINLSGCIALTDSALEHIGWLCPLLQVLRVWGCISIRGPGLVPLAAGCRALEKLVVFTGVFQVNSLLECIHEFRLR